MNRELDELLGAYVLDAVDADERARLDELLAADPEARREADELLETVAMLALTQTEGERAPTEIWDRIEASIAEPIFVDEVAARRRTREQRRPAARVWLAAAAAAVLVVAAALSVTVLRRSDTRTMDLATAFRATAHAGRDVPIVATHGKVLAHVAFTRDGNGYLRADDLAALGPDSVYQLWVIPQGSDAALSAGVLGADPHLAAFHWAGTPKAFAISRERAPGARVPGKVLGVGAL